MRSVLASTVVAIGMVAAAYAEVTVETTGIAKVKPDVAYLTFSVSQRGTDLLKVDAAVRQQAKQLADKLSKLPGCGPAKSKSRKPSRNSRRPIWTEWRRRLRFFKGTCALTVECGPNEAVVNNVVSVAVEIGVELGSDSFRGYPGSFIATYGVTKADDAYMAAFADAMKKARAKAQRVAYEAGLKLGRVTGVAEDRPFPMSYTYPMLPVDDAASLEYAGPDPQSVQVAVRFKITFEAK